MELLMPTKVTNFSTDCQIVPRERERGSVYIWERWRKTKRM